jgi:hypothetical protein
VVGPFQIYLIPKVPVVNNQILTDRPGCDHSHGLGEILKMYDNQQVWVLAPIHCSAEFDVQVDSCPFKE